jgi:hypothetical protein
MTTSEKSNQRSPWRHVRLVSAVGVSVAVLSVAPAWADPPAPGGCRAFGQNVAGLATTLGGAFGQIASGVASSGPGAFPTMVVRPEQSALCP